MRQADTGAPLRRGWCPGALRPMAAGDGLLVRLRLTGGILPAATARAVADLARRHGNGLFDLTGRANLQMRGVCEAALPALQDGLRALGLLDSDAGAEGVRNVMASPLAGLHGGPDIRPLVVALERRLAEDRALHALPGKFGFLVDDGSRPSLAEVEADVRFELDGGRFAIGLGGTAGEAIAVGSCAADCLVDEAARIAKIFLSLTAMRPDARRMRDFKATPAVDLLSACMRVPSPARGRRWPDAVGSDEGVPGLLSGDARNGPAPHPTLADARATLSRAREKESARDIVGSQTLHDIGCLGLAVPFGRLDTPMLHAAADLAECSEFAELRLTPWRVILVPGARLSPALPGFITDAADPRLSVAACVGATGCARGSTDTHADAAALATALPPGPGVALHVSGCEKGCAKTSATGVTLVARDGRYDFVRDGRAGDEPVRRGLDLDQARRALAADREPA